MNKRKSKTGKIGKVLLAVIMLALFASGLLMFWMYTSGGRDLRQAAASERPKLSGEETNHSDMKNEVGKVIAWQEDWISFDGKVYEYCADNLNFLLMGIDCAGELSPVTDLSNWDAGQADAIFVVSMNFAEHAIRVIGIPRNAVVSLNIYDETGSVSQVMNNQICLQYGYAGGGELGLAEMKRAVSELMYGLPVHGVCAVSYDAVKVITDKLGGIEVTVPDDMTEYVDDFTLGSTHTLTSDNVIWYLQYRNVNEVGSPTVRLIRQKEFLKIAVQKIFSEVKRNPFFARELYESVISYMNTDISMNEAVYTVSNASRCTLGMDAFYQLSGEDAVVEYINENGDEDFFDDLYINADELKRIMVEVFYREVQVNE